MVVLGSSGGEWLGLFWFQVCWKWLSLALQDVSDWACFVFRLVFRPAKNGYPWLSRMWVTELALSSNLLKKNGCSWLFRRWGTGLSFVFKPLFKPVNNTSHFLDSECWLDMSLYVSSLLITSFLVSPVGKWLPTSQCFKPANKVLLWVFRMWVTSYLVNFILSDNAYLSLTLHWSYFPGLLGCMSILSFEIY